jgi:hypothetical protein
MFIPVATFGRRFLRDDTVETDCRGRLGLDEEMIGAGLGLSGAPQNLERFVLFLAKPDFRG